MSCIMHTVEHATSQMGGVDFSAFVLLGFSCVILPQNVPEFLVLGIWYFSLLQLLEAASCE